MKRKIYDTLVQWKYEQDGTNCHVATGEQVVPFTFALDFLEGDSGRTRLVHRVYQLYILSNKSIGHNCGV